MARARLGRRSGLEKHALASVLKVGILKLHFADRPPNENMEKNGRLRRGRGRAGRAGLNNNSTWEDISNKSGASTEGGSLFYI